MHITYIHGAHASPLSFNYLLSQLPDHQMQHFMYDAHEPIEEILARALVEVDQPTHIVAHSMGGIIGVLLSQRLDNIQTVTTIASPLSGSEVARRIPFVGHLNGLMRNIDPKNPLITTMIRRGAVVPTTCIITSSNHNPILPKPNDGVVTVASQMALPNSKRIHVPINHFEVMVHPDVVGHVKSQIWG